MCKYSQKKRKENGLLKITNRFRLRNDLPVLVSHFTYYVMRDKGERVRLLSEGRKVRGRILIQTESVYTNDTPTNK